MANKKAKVAAVFKSIQGEAKYVGALQVFVRFFGCNLNCSFCDTKLKKFRVYSVEELKKKVDAFKIKFVSCTGGEPLCQAEFLKRFLPLLKKDGYRIYLETNATLYRSLKGLLEFIDIVSFDIKLKSSTGEKNLWKVHEKFFSLAKEKEIFFKTVITPFTSFDDIKRLRDFMKDKKEYLLYLQPDTRRLSKKLLEKVMCFQEYLLKASFCVRVLPQVHKLLGIR